MSYGAANKGTLIFNSTTDSFQVWDGSAWQEKATGANPHAGYTDRIIINVRAECMLGDSTGICMPRDDSDTTPSVEHHLTTAETCFYVAIPAGFTATHVAMYGAQADTYDVYKGDVTGTAAVQIGTALDTGSEEAITNVPGALGTFIMIKVLHNVVGQRWRHGYVKVA
jgi:hypothetical protein